MTRLAGRIALVTGASRGIGAAAAVKLAAEGAHVILTGRDAAGLEQTDDAIRQAGGSATLAPLDLTDVSLLQFLAEQVATRYGRLDLLVGNAAQISDLSPLPDVAPGDFERVLCVNLAANWHLIRCFDSLLKAAPEPAAIFVTSGVTARPAAYWGPYAISKAALEAMVKIYAAETKGLIVVNLLDPGALRTRMRAQAYPGEDAETLPPAVTAGEAFITLALEKTRTGQIYRAKGHTWIP